MGEIRKVVDGVRREGMSVSLPFLLDVDRTPSYVWFAYRVHHGIGRIVAVHMCPVDDVEEDAVASYEVALDAPCDISRPLVRRTVSDEAYGRRLEEAAADGTRTTWKSLMRGAEHSSLYPLYQAVCDYLTEGGRDVGTGGNDQ